MFYKDGGYNNSMDRADLNCIRAIHHASVDVWTACGIYHPKWAGKIKKSSKYQGPNLAIIEVKRDSNQYITERRLKFPHHTSYFLDNIYKGKSKLEAYNKAKEYMKEHPPSSLFALINRTKKVKEKSNDGSLQITVSSIYT